MLRCVLFLIYSIVLNMIMAQAPNLTHTADMPLPSTNEELLSSITALKDKSMSKREKFSCLINLLKTVLSEELENAQVQIKNDEDSMTCPIEMIEDQFQIKSYDPDDELIEKQESKNGNDTSALEMALYYKIMTKIASTLSKVKIITTNIQPNEVLPNIAPNFKPKPTPNQYLPDNKLNAARQVLSPAKGMLTAEINVQANLNPNVHVPAFTIPCHRASDILEGPSNIAMPNQAFCENVANIPNPKAVVNPIAQIPKPVLPGPNVTPITLSVDYADLDETVAMIFKPKAISLMQLYGNMLKKITVTVLVPYSISKIAT